MYVFWHGRYFWRLEGGPKKANFEEMSKQGLRELRSLGRVLSIGEIGSPPNAGRLQMFANFSFAANLANAIGNLEAHSRHDDFGAFLISLTERIAKQIFDGTPGSSMETARMEAAHAVEVACKRDGVNEKAKVATAMYIARKGA